MARGLIAHSCGGIAVSYDLYQENIIDYYKHPRNKGQLKNPDIKFRELNPLCGDDIEVQLKLDGKTIKEISFDGHGCAISQAAASMMAEQLEGKSLTEAEKFDKEAMLEMLGIPISAARMKCALLGVRVLKEGVYKYEKKSDDDIRKKLSKEGLLL